MKHALLGALSTLLLPFSAHAAASSAGGYLMRGGYQPRSYMRMGQDGDAVASLPLGKATSHKLRPGVEQSSDTLDIQQHAGITELVVIDSSVQDRATLYAGLNPGVGVVEIDAGRPGLPQLVQALRGYRDLAAIHVVSHASPGALQLGSSRITAESLHAELGTMQALRASVREGADLLFYGCDLAANADGGALLDIVRSGTGMDVAASSNLTGAVALGGDWELEERRGGIESGLAFSEKALKDFSGVLVASSGTKTFQTGWVDNNANLTSADFVLTAKDAGGSPISNVSIDSLSYFAAYLQTGYNNSTTGTYFQVAADGTNTGSFELTGLVAGELAEGQFTNVHIVGIKPDNSTVTSGTIIGTGSSGETFTFGAGQLANFSGVKLKAFKLVFDTSSGPATKTLFEFRNFTVTGAQGPLPVVSDSRISISGASGTGGTYKIGDTVTATWNNTAGGDNNAGITGVTMDFSQFGGGAVVATSNGGNTWTATYSITSGSIDATNRNISVSATNAAGTTTTADTTNATVDNIAPTVTDARISISGATGTSGAYKIGDTVTATWNNTAGGDNNADTMASVTVNFTDFGGGAAVAATNSSGTWTATYTIVSGSIDATNRNVTVTATDNAGNATVTADTTNARVDNNPPSVSSIVVSGSPSSADSSMAFTVTFDETVTNVSTDDFTLVGAGAIGTIASVSASNGSSVNVNIAGISGNGTIRVNLNGSTNIVDGVGNPVPSYSSGSTHTVAVPTAPGVPTIGTATAGDGQATVTFTAPGDGGSPITTYTATANPGGITGSCAGPTACAITVGSLTNGTAYTFSVTATNGAGTGSASAASNSVTPMANQIITFTQPPSYNFGATPTLTASSTYAVSGAATGFAIDFTSSTTGVCTVTSGGALTFVSAGTCTIDADQAGNASTNAASTVTRSFTVNAIVPSAPGIGSATAGNERAEVSFSAPPSNGGATITDYTVTANPGGNTGAGSSSPIIVAGLTNGVSYTFSVTATNSAGTSVASVPSNAVAPAGPQIITFANPGSQNFGSTPDLRLVNGGASATSGLDVTFTSSTTAVCTVTSEGVLAFIATGSCTILANQAGNSAYLAATPVSRTFTVNAVVAGAPTSSVATAGDTQVSVSFVAPSNTGGTSITGYTVTVSPADVTPVNGAASPIVVTGLTNGRAYTFTVTADNSAGTGPASSASNPATPKAAQTITFVNPGAQNFGTTPALSANSDSGLTPTFTSSTNTVCTITAGGALTFVTVGTCTINVDQTGNASYLAATQVTRSFTVNAVVAGAPQKPTVTAGDGAASVAFTAPTFSGGAAITGYTVAVIPADVAPVSASSSPIAVTGLTNGQAYEFTVTANNSVGAGPASTPSNAVTPTAAQVITFANPGTQDFGTTPTLTATADSGLAATFTTGTANICTVSSGGALSFLSVGTCTIHADQNGDASHAAATRVSQSFTVRAVVSAAPVIGAATLSSATVAEVSFAAPAFDGGAAITQYEVVPSPSVAGGPFVGNGSPLTVTGLVAGQSYTFTVLARNSAGDSQASAATNAVQPMTGQSITFNNPGTQNFGTTPTLSASASSGLAVSLSVDGATAAVCSINSGVLSFASVGTCKVLADQAGDASHDPAVQVSQSFNVQAVAPAAPVIGTAAMTSATAAEISFTAPGFDGGAAITHYEVVPSPAVAGGPFVASSSPVAVDGLTAGQSYTFSVIARNSAGDSPASAASNALQPMVAQAISFSVAGSYDFGTTPTLVATSSSGLAVRLMVDAGSASVCAINNEVLSFAAVGSCTVHADQAGDASHSPAARVSQSFMVQAVVPAAPVIGSATMLSETSAEISFAAPAFDGGTAITGYQVLPHPATVGGATYVGKGSPIRVTGLTKGVHYSFAVVAINSVGEGAASALSNTLFMVPLLEAHPVTQNVAYGTATEITLSATGAYQAVSVVVGPGNGSASVHGTRLTYTPTLGYAGPDSFTYAVMDGYSSATATVDVMVGPPSLSMDSGVPDAVASSVYQHQLVTHGGIEGYTYVVTSGSLPPGVKLSAAGLLSGTPTQTGSFTFTVSSTDSSTGAGPFTVAQGYTLAVTHPDLELATSTLMVAFGGQQYRTQLRSQGGTAPYSYSVAGGQLPAGLSLSTEGEISGVPEMAGTFAFIAQVTDANGFADTADLSLKVEAGLQVIHDMATDPAEPVFATGGTFVVSAQGGQSGNPLLYGSGSPAICSVVGNVVTMLDAGTCVLTIDQAGNAQYLAAQQAVLQVDIAAAMPSLTWLDGIAKVYGEAAFDLPDPRSNSTGAFSFSSSDTKVATISGRTVTLVGEGSATLTAYQAAQGGYTAASVELNLTVNARPDPTADANVRGSLQAQVDASVRFSRVQLGNIQSRLQQVRSGSNPSSATLTLAYAGDLLGQAVSVPVQLPVNQFTGMPSGWGGWMSGTATFGNSGQQQGGSFDFNTDGISLGVDRSYGDNGLLGMAASLGRNRSRLDNSPSRMDADQYSLAVYGLWRAGEHLFVDGVLAQGRLSFDIARWSDDANAVAVGQRDGNQTFGALTFGYQQQHGATTLSGYGRFDGSQSHLDGYREHGLQTYDLVYARQTVRNSGLALGFDGSYSWQGERLQLRPFWKLEYRQSLSNNGDAWMNYVQQPSTDGYLLKMQGYADNMLTAGLGLDMQTRNGWLISLLFGRDQGSNSASSNSVGLRVSYGKGGAGSGNVGAADGVGLDECQGRRCRRGTGMQGHGEQIRP
ncbi:fibronectin type III domain-containing protein [Stenotrophomonas sp.]|uniref:fibronectin type III domain-containing protein n=1 Tax=Stenotrophomonas sp. TaxID=69392 RepID=UPI0028AA48B9|nr:fibronectin type III domain-containing protein [Stenotrophomonas sp.]